MCLQSRLASLLYKLAVWLVCGAGLLLETGLLNGSFSLPRLLYYPAFICLLCLLLYLIFAIVVMVNMGKTGSHGPISFAPHLKGGLVMALLLCPAVHYLVLGNRPFAGSGLLPLLTEGILYLLLPFMVLLDWCLFDRKGRFLLGDPMLWMMIPLLYFACMFMAAQAGFVYANNSAYPYAFLNPDTTQGGIGWEAMMRNVLLLAAAWLIVGYAYLLIDSLLGRRARRKAMADAYNLPGRPTQQEYDADYDEVEEDLDDLDDLLAPQLHVEAEAAPPYSPQQEYFDQSAPQAGADLFPGAPYEESIPGAQAAPQPDYFGAAPPTYQQAPAPAAQYTPPPAQPAWPVSDPNYAGAPAAEPPPPAAAPLDIPTTLSPPQPAEPQPATAPASVQPPRQPVIHTAQFPRQRSVPPTHIHTAVSPRIPTGIIPRQYPPGSAGQPAARDTSAPKHPSYSSRRPYEY